MDVEIIICEICNKNNSKYKCSRCSINYCSVVCFNSKTHVKCSEDFYRNCCMSELKGVNVTKEMKEKMENILSSESNDYLPTNNNNTDSLEDRLYDLTLDDTDQIWERLTEKEKEEFYQFIQSDDLKKFIKCWKPWWIFEMVEEVTDNVNLYVPKIYKHIVSIDKLISKPPSKSNRYTIISILLSYAYITRRYNGDHHNFIDEIEDLLPKICPDLFSTIPTISTSIEDVIGSFIFNAANAKIQLNNAFLMLIIDDLFYFLNSEETSRHFIAPALSDVRLMLKRSDNKLKPILKKVEFYISWITTTNVFHLLIDDLKEELEIAKMVNTIK